ncbi:type II toxin-antitoxin system PemK/MazF family toxin [Geotalea toluenoxydans]|uniref:type II toxin-antitoxin system PemK/MazF family toxin n=1 Tax=Geotalea toluenoxydans TaxID=421624 RepID=UPI000B2FABBC|nr:type II toxin-antitoxin system PemK/MazF family toxin [Geotalea toluenoxydans]
MKRRGEIWTANLNPGRGREIDKIRPVLVIQDNALTARGTPMVVILPLTTQVYPSFKLWRIMIEPRDRLLKPCQVVVDQPRALDLDRFGDGPLTSLTPEEMATVEKSLKGVLGLL